VGQTRQDEPGGEVKGKEKKDLKTWKSPTTKGEKRKGGHTTFRRYAFEPHGSNQDLKKSWKNTGSGRLTEPPWTGELRNIGCPRSGVRTGTARVEPWTKTTVQEGGISEKKFQAGRSATAQRKTRETVLFQK